MKNFLTKIGHSFYNSDLYYQAKEESVWNGIKFVTKVSATLGLIFGVIVLSAFIIGAPYLNRVGVNFIEKSFPTDLIVTVKGGEMSTNVPGPIYAIPFKKDGGAGMGNMVALVPDEKLAVDIFSRYDAYAIFAKDGFMVKKSDVESRIYPYGKMNKVFTKDSTIQDFGEMFKIAKTVMSVAIIPIILLTFIMSSFMSMVYMFIFALIVLGFLKLCKISVTYKQAYKMGVYTIVPFMLLSIILVPLHMSGVLMRIVVTLAVMYIATRNWNKMEVVSAPAVVGE